MSNKNFTIMVVPHWLPNAPEVIRELAYVAEYYNRDCHKLFQAPHSFTDVNESLRVFFMLEGLTQRLTYNVPRDNYHHVQMTKRLLHEVNRHHAASLDFLSNKILMREVENGKFHKAFDIDVKTELNTEKDPYTWTAEIKVKDEYVFKAGSENDNKHHFAVHAENGMIKEVKLRQQKEIDPSKYPPEELDKMCMENFGMTHAEVVSAKQMTDNMFSMHPREIKTSDFNIDKLK